MSQDPSSFVGSIPEFYDRNLGPNIFVDYADDIARRVAAASPKRVLELAAGTGIVTLALRKHLPPSTQLTATDLNQPMLDIAQKKFANPQNLAFQTVDAQNIPFPDASFDTAICQFGVMFFPDKDRSYREVFRVLPSGGRYIFSVWDAPSFNPFGRIAHETIGGFFKSDPPKFYQVPFGYHSIDAIKQSLIAAGFGGIAVSVLDRTKEAGDLDAFADGLVRGNPAIEEIKARASVPAETIIAAVADKLKAEFGPSRRMPLQAIVFEAQKR
jgi:SAM-dependent methyltransferase